MEATKQEILVEVSHDGVSMARFGLFLFDTGSSENRKARDALYQLLWCQGLVSTLFVSTDA